GACHDSDTLRLRRGQDRVGRDDARCRVLSDTALHRDRVRGCGNGRRQAETAELLADFPGCGPEMRAVADGDATDGIDGSEGTDGMAGGELHGSRADAALEVFGGGAGAGADAA